MRNPARLMPQFSTRSRALRGFTLAEVMISVSLAGVALGGIIYGYVASAKRAEWSAYSLAAHSLALQKIEQVRAAQWDPYKFPPIDVLGTTNAWMESVILDIPLTETNVVFATNYTTITNVSLNPPLRAIHVDCVWMFGWQGPFTNSIVVYRSPDQ